MDNAPHHPPIPAERRAAWRDALAERPRGWDLSKYAGYREEETPWRYDTVARNLAQVSHHVLDLGTGGGEFLAGIADVLPEDTVATERFPEDRELAIERLAPLGIEVIDYDATAPGASLPFAPGRFDLVLVRHERFDAADVHRVLAPGGMLVTEQVGGDDLRELQEAFSIAPDDDDEAARFDLQRVEREITTAGFHVERSDAFRGSAEFHDMPTLLRFLRREPWLAPEDLDVERHADVLASLAARMADGPLQVHISRFWVLARTPEAPRPPVTDFSRLLHDVPEVPKV